MIEASHLSFSYGDRPALSDVSLGIGPGEFIGLMGPNSSGKSTLLRLLSRELRPNAGEIQIRGTPLAEWPLDRLARTVAVVSSEEHFNFPFTVDQIVLMGRIPHLPRGRRESPLDRQIAQGAMESTDVLALRDRAIHELSSGERQRVMLARALAQEPQILILDEPTVHLDIGHAWSFFELLQRLYRTKDLTILCSLHDLTLASSFCTRLVMLHKGRVHSQGQPQDVLKEETLREVFGVAPPVESWRAHPQARVVLKIE